MFAIAMVLYLFSAIEMILSFGRDVKDSIASKVFDDKNSDARMASMHKSNGHFIKSVLAMVIATLIIIYG